MIVLYFPCAGWGSSVCLIMKLFDGDSEVGCGAGKPNLTIHPLIKPSKQDADEIERLK